MRRSTRLRRLFGRERGPSGDGFAFEIASCARAVRECQRLRHRVFAEEMGAHLPGAKRGLDIDPYDAHCRHLLVRAATGGVIACTRLLSDADARNTGGFYAQSEFHLGRLPLLAGRKLEIGRTCVHPDYRTGSAITCLWMGLARFMQAEQYDFLLGCASVDMRDGGAAAWRIYRAAVLRGQVRVDLGVIPRMPLPDESAAPAGAALPASASAMLPPLLKAYLSLGAKICGEPSCDRDFRVADMMVLLDRAHLAARYARHFLRAAGPDGPAAGRAAARTLR